MQQSVWPSARHWNLAGRGCSSAPSVFVGWSVFLAYAFAQRSDLQPPAPLHMLEPRSALARQAVSANRVYSGHVGAESQSLGDVSHSSHNHTIYGSSTLEAHGPQSSEQGIKGLPIEDRLYQTGICKHRAEESKCAGTLSIRPIHVLNELPKTLDPRSLGLKWAAPCRIGSLVTEEN